MQKDLRGTVMIMNLVYITLFVMVAGSIAVMAITQHRLGQRKLAWEQALQIAEAGVNYYRWHLAHDPTDYTDGTGQPGPYVHTYNDAQGGEVGTFSLTITPPNNCANTITITSTGSPASYPSVSRTVRAVYGKPSLAQFAFLTNSNVWFGENEELHGPVHSNGGIRQDGENDGIVTSAKETYICGPEHGCNNETKPGIWGAGEKQELWSFPVTAVDFGSITADLASLKSEAQTNGIYLGSSGLGYHLVLRSDGYVDVYQVNSLQPNVYQYDGNGWKWDSIDIASKTFLASYPFPSNCSIIFVEDDLWIEGEINNRSVTVVSANLPDVSETNTSIAITGDILYTNRNEQTSLALIAQKDILIPLYAAPNQLEINAVLLAQKGHVFRNHYPSWYSPYYIRDELELYGAIITNNVWTWTWVSGSGTVLSGYQNTETIYDPNLKYNPPPGFPTESQYDFIEWEEITDK